MILVMNNFVLVKRSLLMPWKKIYVKERLFNGYTTTTKLEEAQVFEDLNIYSRMRIEDDFFFTRFEFKRI